MVAVGFSEVIGYDGIVAGARCWRKLQVEMACVDFVNLYAVYFASCFMRLCTCTDFVAL